MIFNQLNDLLFVKSKDHLTNIDQETDYNPYMVNRWVSMYSPDLAHVINNTVNWLYPIFETKSDHYNFLHAVLPRSSRKRINYIKKRKPDKGPDEPEHSVEMLARNLELSQREVQQMIDMS